MSDRFSHMHDDYLDPDRHLWSEVGCQVCGVSVDDCDCPECPRCGSTGDPECYTVHGLEPAHDSIHSLCQKFGIEPVQELLRAVEKYNTPHLWFELANPLPNGKSTIYYWDFESQKMLQPWMRLTEVGVSGIAWDGSDWEWTGRAPAGNGWEVVGKLFEDFEDALEEWEAMWDEDGTWDEMEEDEPVYGEPLIQRKPRMLTSLVEVAALVVVAAGLWLVAGFVALLIARFFGWI